MEGRALMASSLTRFAIPLRPHSQIENLTKGADGNFWFDVVLESHTLTTTFGKITPSGAVTLFPSPAGLGVVGGLTPLADGTLWFTSSSDSPVLSGTLDYHIGKITPNGSASLFDVPKGILSLDSLIAASDGNLWFVEGKPPQLFLHPGGTAPQFTIARITPQGHIEELPTPAALAPVPGVADSVTALTAAPDGSLWFSAVVAVAQPGTGRTNALVRIVPTTGQLRTFTIPSTAGVNLFANFVITTDGSVWVDEVTSPVGLPSRTPTRYEELDRLSPSGEFLKVSYPRGRKGNPGGPQLSGGETADSNGNLWFFENTGTRYPSIARLNAAGVGAAFRLREIPKDSLIPGIDGSMFFQAGTRTIGRVTASGKVSYANVKRVDAKSTSRSDAGFNRLTIGADGNLWFVENNSRFIDRYVFSRLAKPRLK